MPSTFLMYVFFNSRVEKIVILGIDLDGGTVVSQGQLVLMVILISQGPINIAQRIIRAFAEPDNSKA